MECNKLGFDIIDRRYDEELCRLIKNDGLSWLLWIGDEYCETNLLVVGESNYADQDTPDEDAKSAGLRVKQNHKFTRGVVSCFCVCRKRKNQTFDGIGFVLQSGSRYLIEESVKVWRRIAFMDLVQIPMLGKGWGKVARNRPSMEAMEDGWCVLRKVVEILKPKAILFVGCSTVTAVKAKKRQRKFGISELQLSKKDKRGILAMNDGCKIPFYVMPNPGSAYGFSKNEWQKIVARSYGLSVERKEGAHDQRNEF